MEYFDLSPIEPELSNFFGIVNNDIYCLNDQLWGKTKV
jgi:hypothetical protein